MRRTVTSGWRPSLMPGMCPPPHSPGRRDRTQTQEEGPWQSRRDGKWKPDGPSSSPGAQGPCLPGCRREPEAARAALQPPNCFHQLAAFSLFGKLSTVWLGEAFMAQSLSPPGSSPRCMPTSQPCVPSGPLISHLWTEIPHEPCYSGVLLLPSLPAACTPLLRRTRGARWEKSKGTACAAQNRGSQLDRIFRGPEEITALWAGLWPQS